MIAAKQLSLAALLWLGLANQGLALGIDEATNDLTLMERSPAHKGPMAKVTTPGHSAGGPIHHLRDEEEELDTRDEEVIEERDFDELDERDFEELDERDLDIETRGERPGHAPSHGPKKHRRDLEESDLETRSPIRAIPGGNRGSWGGQNGPKRPRDIEARGSSDRKPRPKPAPVPIGGRPSGVLGKKKTRGLEESDLETRSPIRAIPGGTRGSWGGQNGPKRPRDIETRSKGMPGTGGRPGVRPRPRPSGRSLDVRMGAYGKARGPRINRPRALGAQ